MIEYFTGTLGGAVYAGVALLAAIYARYLFLLRMNLRF
jgi:hypothetical protein